MGCWICGLAAYYTSILVASIAVLAALLLYIKHRFNYWKNLNVETLPVEIPLGDLTDIYYRKKYNLGQKFRQIYEVMKSKGQPFAGAYVFASPVFVPIDLDVLKNIMQNDFVHFGTRGFYSNAETDPLMGNLFTVGMKKWRKLRIKLTPTFTSGKMKVMFNTITDVAEGLQELVEDLVKSKEPIDARDIFARFNTDVIGSCAFGIQCHSLKNPHVEFRIQGEKTFEPKLRGLLPLFVSHEWLHKIGYRLTSRDAEDFFMGLVKQTIQYRENNNVLKNDFMHLLIQLKNNGYLADDETVDKGNKESSETIEKLTMNELAAQCFLFFMAGFETSSTTTNFAVFELATHQEIQDRARQEIKDVMEEYNGNLTYDGIMKMTYLDKVAYETLRKYPPVNILNRECTRNYRLPGTSVVLEKGTFVFIPIMGIHNDPEFWPDPEKFDPERFDEDKKKQRPQFSWIPFGEGPRICIGQRFAMLQVKVGLITLLKDYRITLNEKTKTPLEFDPVQFVTTAKGGIWINLTKIN